MERKDIQERLHSIIDGLRSSWNNAEITDSSDLREDIGLESIDFLEGKMVSALKTLGFDYSFVEDGNDVEHPYYSI